MMALACAAVRPDGAYDAVVVAAAAVVVAATTLKVYDALALLPEESLAEKETVCDPRSCDRGVHTRVPLLAISPELSVVPLQESESEYVGLLKSCAETFRETGVSTLNVAFERLATETVGTAATVI